MELIHCGDAQGDMIHRSIGAVEEKHPWLSIPVKKDRDRSASGVFAAPNLVIRSEITEKMVDILKTVGDRLYEDNPAVSEAAATLKTPVFLKLYVSSQCPHCPKAARTVSALAALNPNIHVEIIDGLLYGDKSEQDRIRSVPTLILDDNFRWTGDVQAKDVMDVITQRDPEQLSARAVQVMIESGKASHVAGLMIEKGRVFASLFELILHEKWPVRLGAMVVAEEAGVADPNLGRDIMDGLWAVYDTVADTLKGDIIYLAGEIGARPDRERLLSLDLNLLDEELRDAVTEALAALDQRQGQ